jgi:hypothetical protein
VASILWIRVSAVFIKIDYGLDDRGVGVRVPVGSKIFSSSAVQIGSEVHPVSYLWGTGSCFREVKRSEREADQSLQNNVEVKKTWICTSTPLYTFIAYCLIS